ncbi:hypothetical protein GQ53DRAFT_647957 [Thozetella sp. PMI_491]|nr:hypothetical protein GQ53DRAFT_647957 [Thozetella sp. PMI_491]
MKTAKPAPAEGSSSLSRRAQPVRQTRTNPPRTSSLNRINSLASGPGQENPIDIFPAVTHFADAITAVPKELVRHFTLLKEVDAKIFAPEEALLQLVEAALASEPHDAARLLNDSASSIAPASVAMSAQGSNGGATPNGHPPTAPSTDEHAHGGVFDPSNYPRRQLFRDTALKIQEMLVSLEEKNHVISTANDILHKELGRIESVWPALESEFSEEAKWGSNTHWAYLENRLAKANNTQAERSRREGAATLSAAAQQLAEEAAARSSDRKQALAAKKNAKNQAAEADADKHHESSKKSQTSKSRKPPAEPAAPVGLGISTVIPPANGNPAPKRRKVENLKTNGGVPMERAMSSVFGNTASKAKTTSPRETPVPDGGNKKRKALPTSSNQVKKSRTGAGSVTSSPVVGTFPDSIKIGRSSPAPPGPPRPVSSRARQNSVHSATDNPRQRPPSAASNKPNGVVVPPPEVPTPPASVRPSNPEPKAPQKEPPVPSKPEPVKAEVETPEAPPPMDPVPNGNKKEKEAPPKAPEEKESKKESNTPIIPPVLSTTITTTKSGRASKPSTPALVSTFAEAANPRARPSRAAEGTVVAKRSHKKGASSISAASTAATLAAKQAAVEEAQNSNPDEDDGDEPRYCYCNNVSYGEMVACDADGCPREWFHLECVGLKVAPKGNAKWYCEDCKKRLKVGEKKINGR